MIQDDIEITVLSVDGENVRIGIKAPKSVDVYRKEIYLAIEETNREAATISDDPIEALMKRFRNEP